ncbi:unnamed protein product [Brassica rapa]|nr:unnamed protein product [Brassica rapa]VDD06525.1 unnamed protein product [Brassica rapa]
MRSQRDQDSRAFYDLSALVLSLLRSPPMPISLPDHFPDSPMMRTRSPSMAHISPSGFASLLLGISVALMLCGSVTFFIGFLLLPWVLALIVVLYVAGIVSAISMAGRSILSYVLTPPPSFSSRKDISDVEVLSRANEKLLDEKRNREAAACVADSFHRRRERSAFSIPSIFGLN